MKHIRTLFALVATAGLFGLTSCASTHKNCASCCASGAATAKKECCVKAGGECKDCAAKKAAAAKKH